MKDKTETHGESILKPKQKRALAALLVKSLDEVCEDTGISRPTLWRWMKEPEFKDELKKAQDELFTAALGQLKSNLERAVQKVAALMDSTRADVALRAAQSLIEYNLRIRQIESLEQKIAELEAAVQGAR